MSDKNSDWLGQAATAWNELLPLADAKAGPGDAAGVVQAIFRLTSSGLETGRDEWVYSPSEAGLAPKIHELLRLYDDSLNSGQISEGLKLDRQLNRLLEKRTNIKFSPKFIRSCTYGAFVKNVVYFDKNLNSYQFKLPYFCQGGSNPTISYDGMAASYPLTTLAVDGPFDKGLMKVGNGRAFAVARYRYNKSGERVDNITDWAVAQFVAHYGEQAEINKDAIFAYCYAVLHDPLYREKYALNLKREFPRIPFYTKFDQWVEWGEALLKLHIDYEKVKPAKLTRVDTPAPKRAEGTHPKAKLKSDATAGKIVIDEDTQLTGVPVQAWEYRLGNRSAIDWVLDQHKEKTPRDPTIREKYNTYRFADYKESCIELLMRVVSVSVATVAIIEAMKTFDR